jgi:hypothetical protein
MLGISPRPRIPQMTSGLNRPSGRTAIFWLEIFYLVGLGVLAAAYLTDWIDPRHQIGSVPTPVVWFGALGAVLISLTGVFDHPYDWDNGFLLWHIARPLVGAAVAVVAVLIVVAGILAVGSDPSPASSATNTTDIFYYLVAFVVGFREETFRLLVKRLADVVLTPGAAPGTPTAPGIATPPGTATASPPIITAVAPRSGNAGDVVTITGSGLTDTHTVRFGTAAGQGIEIASDASLTATVPPGQPGTEVVVAVSTPGGETAGPTFTYLP